MDGCSFRPSVGGEGSEREEENLAKRWSGDCEWGDILFGKGDFYAQRLLEGTEGGEINVRNVRRS